MIKLYLKLDQGTPQYVCSSCGNCHSTFGKSMCKIKDRGCCFYFPKFTLYEIHKMTKSKEGFKTLKRIVKNEGTKIYNYYIHAKGYFDEEGYERHMTLEDHYDDGVHDKTIFFRACPFIKQNEGCTLPLQYRSYVCNFFICDEVKKVLEKSHEFYNYVKECESYVRWIKWENESLRGILEEQNINLEDNFEGVINLLKDIPLENFEFRKLEKIEFKQ
ncbi:hypothetical protein [Clostridium felsineum]|uniref:Uncharacterized protein n=2 Tax=Clostridium felsineum TaxID=36839 RepID=A0A1S8MD68_9CLOT|nr:hypothetical protein [Clostridium felsineum]URZ03159.1 hypothetical protein CLAUR_032050 [Clostridium felsineum]URZ08496.1 hypothetical protein CLROS_038780 [Clostridium felsineum]URZ13527.1 hypothetical protein CROST_042930 [Clostridium felsineum]